MTCAVVLAACGDDSGKTQLTIMPPRHDGGRDSGSNNEPGTGGKKPPRPTNKDAGASDSGTDSSVVDPFAFDAAGDYRDGAVGVEPPQPVPDAWNCPAALWNDGHCDCGCFATDGDCSQSSCSTLTGCDTTYCAACFTPTGAWTPCAVPNPSAWTCGDAALVNNQCDCGCGIPDPECNGQGCTEPGCRVPKCSIRHGCIAGVITAIGDNCTGTSVPSNWKCADGSYGSGDGCDCGCGVIDPDCSGAVSCTASRCYVDACQLCHAGEDPRGPYSCDAAKAGWDDDIDNASGAQPSLCNGTHFGTDDGCDCGCGGVDPDCGTEGTPIPGATDPACNRCTDVSTLQVTGCGIPSAWTDSKCNPANFGTGDGCDCGCATPDPDCDALGKAGSTVPGADDPSCDVCNDGAGGFNPCPNWTCTNAIAISTGDCDCGCGVVDPACRLNGWLSCTEAGCSTEACKYSNDGAARTPHTSLWDDGVGGGGCSLYQYGVDGLCDCGCGVHDPDCEVDQDCTTKGCFAPGCDACHDGTQLGVCYVNRCDATAMTDAECDCGCSAPDPACGFGLGCTQPGCKDAACTVCHDPFGRPIPCP
jgi:hypothetical protein